MKKNILSLFFIIFFLMLIIYPHLAFAKTINFDTEYRFSALTAEYISIAKLTDNKFIVAWSDVGGNNGQGRAVIGTIEESGNISYSIGVFLILGKLQIFL